MIKRIEFSGINGIPHLRVDFSATGLIWLYGDSASGKTTLLDVLQILRRIARGMASLQQVLALFPRAVRLEGYANVVIDFANKADDFRYELGLSNGALLGSPTVVREALYWVHNLNLNQKQCLLVRDASGVSMTGVNGMPVKYPVEPSVVAFATVMDAGLSPLTTARSLLGDMLLIKLEISQMRDDVLVPGGVECGFIDLASQLAQAFQRVPAVYSHIECFCRKLIGGFQGIVIREAPPYGRYLYVQKLGREYTLSMLSESEKRVVALAFVYALGMLYSENVCYWDDFLLGIPDAWVSECIGLVSAAYAKGQFIATTSLQIGKAHGLQLQ